MPITVDYVGVNYSPLTRDEGAVVLRYLRLKLIPLARLLADRKTAHLRVEPEGSRKDEAPFL